MGKQILSCLLVETKLVQAFAGEFGDIYQNEESGSDVPWRQIPDSAVVGPNLDQSLRVPKTTSPQLPARTSHPSEPPEALGDLPQSQTNLELRAP